MCHVISVSGRIQNICLKWHLIWISESWKHQNCLEIRRMQTSTWLKHGDRSPAWVVKKRVRLHFLCTLQERALCSILWNASIDYISQIKVKHLEKPAQHLSIFISITSRCNSLSLHCWCGMNWFICHLLVKKFNFDVVCIFLQMTFLQHEAGFFLVDHFLSE